MAPQTISWDSWSVCCFMFKFGVELHGDVEVDVEVGVKLLTISEPSYLVSHFLT
jgi:hypothetical protein